MDIIYIHGLQCECVIGVWEWEQQTLQTLVLDIDLASDITSAAASDALEDSVDYQAVSEAVREYAAANPAALLETMIDGMAAMIMARFAVPWLRIKMDKGSVLDGVAHVGVIIERGQRPDGNSLKS